MVKVSYNRYQYGVSSIEHIRTYPLTSVLPLRADIDLEPAAEKGVHSDIIGVELLESFIGTLLLLRGHNGMPRQASFVIPSPSVLSQHISRKKEFDLASTPFRLTRDSLMIYYAFNVGVLYEILYNMLLQRFITDLEKSGALNDGVAASMEHNGKKLVCEIVFDNEEPVEQAESILSQYRSGLGRRLIDIIDNALDPKAVLKATTYPHVARWSIEYINPGQGYNRPFFMQVIGYLGFPLRIPWVLVKSIIGNGVKTSGDENWVMLRYHRINTRFLDVLGEAVFNELATLQEYPYAAILRGYCNAMLRFFRKYIERASGEHSGRIGIRLNISDFVQALTYALIEMGIHGYAHCLTRYLAVSVKADIGSVREFVAIAYPYPVLSVNLSMGSDDLYRGIIDGYIYRFHVSPGLPTWGLGNAFIVVAGAILATPYSHSAFHENMHLPNIARMLEICRVSGIDSCYAAWLGTRSIAKSFLESARSSLRAEHVECDVGGRTASISLDEVMERIVVVTENRFKLNDVDSPYKLVHRLYLSRSRYRRILNKLLLRNIVREELKRQGIRVENHKKDTDRCRARVADAVKPYAPMLYEALVPHCFDGCYNCVLTRSCGTKHPIIRDWLVSKSMMRMLLQYSAAVTAGSTAPS